jgi:hypothetical protein
MQFPDTARTCQEGNFLAEYVQIKVKTIIKRLNDVKRQTNYLVCNIEGTGTIDTCMKAEGRWLREDGRVFFCYRYK